MNDMIKYDENFLNACCGNFLDSITNYVHKLQKYYIMFYDGVAPIYLEYDKINNKDITDILRFILIESDELITLKSIKFSIDIEQLINRKHNLLSSYIQKDDIHNFYISKNAFLYLDNFQSNIDWKSIKKAQFDKADDKTYDFISFMDEEFLIYADKSFNYEKESVSKNDLMIILNRTFLNLSTTLLYLKKMNESSNSVFVTSKICKTTISIIVLTYYIIKTIQFDK